MILNRILLLFTLLVLLLFLARISHAQTLFTFSNAPSEISNEDPFSVDVLFAGGSSYKNKQYFLRAVFSKPDSSKYFGYTQNEAGEWGNSGSDKSKLLAITTNEEGSWSGKLTAKIDLTSSYYEDKGSYDFKIGRYTSEGDTSADWSDTVASILVSYSRPPTPTPTSKPTPTPKPTKTPAKQKSSSPAATPTQTTESTQAFFATPDEKLPNEQDTILGIASSAANIASQAGIINLSSASAQTDEGIQPETAEPKASSRVNPLLIVFGGVFSFAGAIPLLKKHVYDRVQ